jgi:transposase InsO family protein
VGRLGRIGLEQPVRYERSRPGELVHVDVKKLGCVRGVGHRISGSRASRTKTRIAGRLRGVAGWEFVHVAVDDYSRLAYVEVLDDERGTTAAGFLRRAVAYYPATASPSNASSPTTAPPTSPPSTHTPAGNSASATCAPARADPKPTAKPNASSAHLRRHLRLKHRTHQALEGWLWHYNHQRRHSALGHQPPATRTNCCAP